MAATELTNPLGTNSGIVPGNGHPPAGLGTGIANGTPGTSMVAGALAPTGALTTIANRIPIVAPLIERFKALSSGYQIGVMVGLAALIAFIVMGIVWSQKEPPPYHIIYGGLADSDTAQVIEALQKYNIPHRIDPNTGALSVPASEVHAIRIRLAGMGLPKTPPVGGFELLDNQSPFGTSQFMEGARYQRALEGELAHSILTLGSVQSARIHLALPRPSVFVRDREKPSASVVLQMHPNRYLDRNQVEAIVHLVASSIPQLETNRVTVVDQSGELLTRQDSGGTREMDLTKAQFEHVSRVENSYVKRIEHMLTPLAGINGIRAQVTVDMDFSDTEHTREVYNPDQPSLRSEQTVEEQSRGARDMGIPGALSNQPPAAGTVPETLNSGGPPPEAGKGVTAMQYQGNGELVTNKRHATRNYEVDRTISHTRSPVGQIRRVSAAVVVDDAFRPGTNPLQRVSRSPEEMERIRALVREAVGYDAQRGDAVSVANVSFMPNFDQPVVLEELPWWRQPWAIELFKQALAALLILVLILGVVRPVMRHLIGEEELEEKEVEELTELVAIEQQPEEATETEEEYEDDDDDDDEEEAEPEEDDTRELKPAGEGAEDATIVPEDHTLLAAPDEQFALEAPPELSEEEHALLAAEQALLAAPVEESPEEDFTVETPIPAAPEEQFARAESVPESLPQTLGEHAQKLPEEPLAIAPPPEPEIPAWMRSPQHNYDDSLEHIRHLIKEEPKMVSEILKEWILNDLQGKK